MKKFFDYLITLKKVILIYGFVILFFVVAYFEVEMKYPLYLLLGFILGGLAWMEEK